VEESRVVGKSFLRLDSAEKVTGRAKFSSDFKMRGMLYARVLRSPYPHARILHIETSKAKHLPGVRSVVTPEDMPRITTAPLFGDQYVLCQENTVRCVGEAVAAVAADTIEIAEEALGLIDVDYEELPAVFDVEEAFRTDPSAIVHPDLPEYRALTGLPIRPDPARPNVCQTYKIRSGNVEKGFQEADLIIENKFTTARIQHVQLEPHVADAWFEADGSLTVRSSTQLVHLLKGWLGRVFNLPPSKVRILSPYIGGGFGGKGGLRAEAIAVLLAQKSRRPVRLAYTREEMFVFGGHRVPYTIYVKDGAKRDGTLVAREMTIMLAIGLYSDFGALLVRRAAAGAVGTYRIPNFKLDSYGVYTNLPLTGALRGFGCPEVEWPIEQQMDIIANELKIDPVEIRKKNVLNEGDRDVSGMVTRSIGVSECLDRVAAWIGWGEKPAEEAGPWKRGKGIAIGNKSVAAGSTSVVIVKIWQDGMIEVRHSAAQLGQGIRTTLAQIAAEEFGLPFEQIRVVSGDTAYCPFDFGTVASRSLIHNGNATIAACQDAKRQLFRIAAPKLEASPGDLVTGEGKVYVKGAPEKSIRVTDLFTPLGILPEGGEILGKGSYTGPVIPEDPETGQSERSVYDYSHTANAVEVAVHEDTGEVRVLRSGMACDMGKAINPKIVEGQIEGGIGMGIGTTLYEQVLMDHGGVVNASLMDYHIPTTLDLPKRENMQAMIIEEAEPEGPFGAKGVGELPLVAPAPAIANAVYNAVGVRIRDLPLSKERVLEGIKKIHKA
jgi:CO/xanthine dehydrogenase Mo-binding subunit